MSNALDQWEQVGTDWSKGDRQRWWRTHTDAVNQRLLDAWLPPSSPRLLITDLFDETAGVGSYPFLAERAHTVVGIDVARSTAVASAAHYPELVSVVCDVRKLCWADDSFDSVVSLSTLDHFASSSDLEASLGELRRVLKAGGTLVITLDNAGNPMVGLRNRLSPDNAAKQRLVPYPVGITFSSPRQFANALERNGFETLEMRATVHSPRVLAVAAARALEGRFDSPRSSVERAYQRALDAFESLGARNWTWRSGHFLAARARRR